MAMVKGAAMSTGKKTGLAAFTQKAQATEQPSETERKRGKGDTVAVTIRLKRSDWERVHQLATSEGMSIQGLAVKGISKVFAEKGLPGI